MYILGINAYHGDAAAAIVKDGEPDCSSRRRAVQSREALCRLSLRVRALLYPSGRHRAQEVEHVGISRDPSAHLHKKVLYAARKGISDFELRISSLQAAATELQRDRWFGDPSAAVLVNNDVNAELNTVTQNVNSEIRNSNFTLRNSKSGNGLLRQVADRLGNAAKVRDLKNELAKVMAPCGEVNSSAIP